jgi:hypothetical protein
VSLHISDAVVWQETAEGVSLYHTETGEFQTLNATGAQIWVLVAGDGERDRVAGQLALLFAGRNEAVGGRIRADVHEFLDTMVRTGMLVETGAEAAAEPEGVPA